MAITQNTGLNNSYDTLLTSKLRTWMKANPVEQTAAGRSFIERVYKTGKHTMSPAKEYTVPVSFIESAKGGYYTGAGVTSTTGSDDVTIARYNHISRTEPIKLFREDKKLTVQGQFDLLTHKIKQARLRMRIALNTDMLATAKASGGPETVPLAIAEAPSGTAFGGIDSNSTGMGGWANQFTDTSAGFAANIDDWDLMIMKCAKYSHTGGPNYILATPAIETYLKAEARSNQAIDVGSTAASGRFADTGYTGTFFQGIPLISDQNSVAESAFFINDSAMYLNVDPTDDFVIEGPFPLQPGGQHGDLWNVYWGGQLIVEERGALGVIFDITGA